VACFKLVPVSFWPLGQEVVSVEAGPDLAY
jgi:uncharacterized membrane protein YccF (DUF307 family)